MKVKIRIPEIILGALLAVVLFAIGMTFEASRHQAAISKSQFDTEKVESGKNLKPLGFGWFVADAAGFFSGLMFFVASIQAGLFVWQLNYMKRAMRDAEVSANAAIESNRINLENFVVMRRSWLSIEDVKLLHPTKFTEEGFIFRVSATAKHHGETPATSVWIAFESYFPETDTRSFSDAEEAFREKLRTHWDAMGETLFKGDTFTSIELWGDSPDKIEGVIKTRPSGERKFGFTIFVGVSYRIVGEKTPRITQYSYSQHNVPVNLEVPDGTSVELTRTPFLAGHIT